MREQIVVVYYCKNWNNQIPRREVDLEFLCSGGRLEESDWSLSPLQLPLPGLSSKMQGNCRTGRSLGRLVGWLQSIFLAFSTLIVP